MIRFSRQLRTFRHTLLTACVGFVAFALLSPSAMAADNCTAPPGTSGLDQYCEALPSPGGTHHRGGGGGGGGSSKHDSIPPATVKQLQRSGAAGAAVLALSGSAPASGSSQGGSGTSGAVKHHARRHHGQSQGRPAPGSQVSASVDTSTHGSAPASNPAAAVGNSVSGSLGAGFFGLLAGIAVLLGALAWIARRRRPGAEGT